MGVCNNIKTLSAHRMLILEISAISWFNYSQQCVSDNANVFTLHTSAIVFFSSYSQTVLEIFTPGFFAVVELDKLDFGANKAYESRVTT